MDRAQGRKSLSPPLRVRAGRTLVAHSTPTHPVWVGLVIRLRSLMVGTCFGSLSDGTSVRGMPFSKRVGEGDPRGVLRVTANVIRPDC
jgi:hypothetical protein